MQYEDDDGDDNDDDHGHCYATHQRTRGGRRHRQRQLRRRRCVANDPIGLRTRQRTVMAQSFMCIVCGPAYTDGLDEYPSATASDHAHARILIEILFGRRARFYAFFVSRCHQHRWRRAARIRLRVAATAAAGSTTRREQRRQRRRRFFFGLVILLCTGPLRVSCVTVAVSRFCCVRVLERNTGCGIITIRHSFNYNDY